MKINPFVIAFLFPISASAQVVKVTESIGNTNVRSGDSKAIGEPIIAINGKASGSYDYQGGKWVLFPNSKFTLEMAGNCIDGGRVSVFIIDGVMEWRWPKHFIKPCSTVKFRTPEAVYKIGGTAFRIDSSKGVTVLGTSTGVVSASAQNVTQWVPGGYYNFTEFGKPPSPPMPISASSFFYVGRPSAGTQRVVLPAGNKAMIGDRIVSGSVDIPLGADITVISPDGNTKSDRVDPQWGR
jgi:hypothetical protein